MKKRLLLVGLMMLLVITAVLAGFSQAAINTVTSPDTTTAAAPVNPGYDHTVPGWHTFTLDFDGYERTYSVYVPWSYTFDGGTPMPVVIQFHGGGGTSVGVITSSNWDAKAEEVGLLYVVPDAGRWDMSRAREGLKFPGGLPPQDVYTDENVDEYGNTQAWNDGQVYTQSFRKFDDIGFIDAMLDELISDYTVDESRIYCTGISNGGAMTYRAGVELGHRLAAIAPVCGHNNLIDVTIKRPVPLLHISGLLDTLSPIDGGYMTFPFGELRRFLGGTTYRSPHQKEIDHWVDSIHALREPMVVRDDEEVELLVYGAGDGGAEVHWYIGKTMGHEFPPDAEDLIWDFFSLWTLP